MTLPFTQVDVFTDRFLLGNPLAVVHDADGLDDETMAAFARWTNLSETTFLLAPTESGADYRVRIFTPRGELPFAGHPTLGSARAWLAAGGRPRGQEIVQQCGVGPVRVRRDGERLAFAAPALLRGGSVDGADVDTLVDALGVEPDEVMGAQWCDNGPGWVALLVRDAEIVLRARPDLSGLPPELGKVGLVGPHPDGSEVAFEVRALVAQPHGGLVEDPVTGSLNAAVGQWLTATGHAPASYVAAQGTVIGRRGRVHVERVGAEVWVGGDTVLGVRGEVALGA